MSPGSRSRHPQHKESSAIRARHILLNVYLINRHDSIKGYPPHPRFPRRVNAVYMQVLDRRRIRLRVYERGTGETLACGTGACAAVVAGVARGALEPERVTVETRGGNLVVSWAGSGKPVMMTGPAVTVFEGEIDV